MDDCLTEVAPLKSQPKYSDTFDECFPFYLSIGMSSAEYWDGDASLPRYFREAYKLKQEHENHVAWLQGMYVYDAVISAMTHMDTNKRNHKSYTTKPFSFDPQQVEKEQEDKVIEAQAQAEVWMKSWVSATQKHFKK